MKITILSETTKLAFAKAIIANELGNQLSLTYKFSDPDGVRTGKSGWSFGIVQHDVNNGTYALACLREAGFTTDEVAALRRQDVRLDMNAMNAKLLAARDVVDKYDRKQIGDCLSWPLQLCTAVEFSGEEAFVHVADYHNQFGMSRGGKMHTWLLSLLSAITPEMVRDFKYTLPWGIVQRKKDRTHDDVWRRYWNIVQIMRPEEVI